MSEHRSPAALERRRQRSKIRAQIWYQNNKARHADTCRNWRETNRERSREIARAGYARRRESEIGRNRRYRQANRERCVANALAWNKSHPEQYKQYKSRNAQVRRARKLGSSGTHTRAQWNARVEFYGWRCVYCRKPLTPKTLRKDHQVPLTRGGTDLAANLVPACHSCNSKKHTKLPKEFSTCLH